MPRNPEIPDTGGMPPEMQTIRLARSAAGLTAEEAAKRASSIDGFKISAGYWRSLERGSGYSRGVKTGTRASDIALAHMAYILRDYDVTPDKLTADGRQSAATIFAAMLDRADRAMTEVGGVNATEAHLLKTPTADGRALLTERQRRALIEVARTFETPSV